MNANDTYHTTRATCPGRQLGAPSSRAQGAMDLPLALYDGGADCEEWYVRQSTKSSRALGLSVFGLCCTVEDVRCVDNYADANVSLMLW